jgi:serine/threonine-protein kinase
MATPAPHPHGPPAASPLPPHSPLPAAFRASAQVPVPALERPSVPTQDLSGDKLLLAAPRVTWEGFTIPALGGIPLLAKLGQGGMGAVYYGIHPRLYLEVAVKVLPFHLAEQLPELVTRFFREARIAAQVKSPHLVGVLDVNEDHGLYYLVMEYVPGTSAAAYLRELKAAGQPGTPETVALDICVAAAQGLGAAHAKGIVHRDVKPENILVPRTPDGRWLFAESKLADLGLARGEWQGQSLTETRAHMGTPGYMAPEQARDAKSAQAPSDVFGLGAALYALLAGQAPFTGSSAFQVLTDTVHRPHRPLSELRPGLAPEVMVIVDRCLQKEPAQRFADGVALAQALRNARAGLSEPGPTLTPWRDATLRPAPSPLPAPAPALSPMPAPAASPVPAPRTPAPAQAAPTSAPLKPALTPAAPELAPAAVAHVGSSDFSRSGAGAKESRTTGRYVLAAAVLALLALGAFLLWPGAPASVREARKETPSPAPVVVKKAPEAPQPEPAAKPAQPPEPSPAAKEEAARRQVIVDRGKTFQDRLAEAAAFLENDPQTALLKLDAAQVLGVADAARGWPDLLASLKPSLETRRDEAKTRLRRRQEEETRKAREEAAGTQFAQEWDAGKQAAARQDWKTAEEKLAAALTALGALEHPDKAATEARLREIRAERQRREDFTAQVKGGERALVEGNYDAAEKAFTDAGKLASDAAAAKEADSGLQACREARLKQRYQVELDAGRAALGKKAWADAEKSFRAAQELRPGDATAAQGIEECRAGARDESCRQALEEAGAARAQKRWAEALAACQRALQVKPNDSAATRLLSEIRYDAAMGEGRERFAAADRLGAEAAYFRALQEKPNDDAATRALAQARERPAPPVQPPAKTEPGKAALARPEDAAFGPPNVVGMFAVYANRPSQGIPLDKNGRLVTLRTDLDKDQYEEAMKARKSHLQIEKGTKVRVEAAGRWFSGPTGSWVGPDGKRADGTDTVKRFRAFQGPENSYTIAKLVAFVSEKNAVATEEFQELEKKGWRWGYAEGPLEFVMPVTGTLRFQQNRDGYYDVTQGALEVMVTLFKPAK